MQNNTLEDVLSPLAGILNQEVARPKRKKGHSNDVSSLLCQNICGLLSKDTLTNLEVTLLGTLLAYYDYQ